MESRELRLHNRVSITEKARKELWENEMDIEPLSTGFITSVDVDECRIILDSMELEMYYEDLMPILLTEEWLLKLGAKKHETILENYFNFYKEKDLEITLVFCNDKGKGEWYVMIKQGNEYEGDIISVPKRMFYVHEWQNLYFALTGKELEINSYI